MRPLARAVSRQPRRPHARVVIGPERALSGVWAAWLFCLPLLLEVNAPLAEERGKFGGLAETATPVREKEQLT